MPQTPPPTPPQPVLPGTAPRTVPEVRAQTPPATGLPARQDAGA